MDDCIESNVRLSIRSYYSKNDFSSSSFSCLCQTSLTSSTSVLSPQSIKSLKPVDTVWSWIMFSISSLPISLCSVETAGSPNPLVVTRQIPPQPGVQTV